MNWLNIQEIKWEEPLTFAAHYAKQEMALLFSGLSESHTGEDSYLFLVPLETHEADTLSDLPFSNNTDALPDWVGYAAYELGLEKVIAAHATLPLMRFVRYGHLLHFNHRSKTLTHYAREGHNTALPPRTPYTKAPAAAILELDSNFTKQRYLQAVEDTIRQIEAGNFYQANITRKFYGTFATAPQPFLLFSILSAISPAPYSAYIHHAGSTILSSSPECFLTVTPKGTITTRPIKGSARRNPDETKDKTIREGLAASHKNLSENLMIVDLMRNDLARVSLPETVRVTEQSALHSYATIHHLISTIEAVRRPDATLSEVVAACFPPGSMTGAPKHAAVAWCASQEQMARGVYSGAIGWLGAHGSCDLSVVIRTLILQGNRFEFQVGGGIVADSTPEEEWQETLTKARGVARALGLTEEQLAAL